MTVKWEKCLQNGLTGQGHLQSVGKCRLNPGRLGKIFKKVHSSFGLENPFSTSCKPLFMDLLYTLGFLFNFWERRKIFPTQCHNFVYQLPLAHAKWKREFLSPFIHRVPKFLPLRSRNIFSWLDHNLYGFAPCLIN